MTRQDEDLTNALCLAVENACVFDDLESQLYSMSELCFRYAISRKTGYKWAQHHVRWGPQKSLKCLSKQQPELSLPASSMAGELLRRHGLSEPRPKRGRWPHVGLRQLAEAAALNELWTYDFKVEFRLGNGQYSYPLTVADRFRRYLLGCEGLGSTARAGVQPAFERLFREQELPQAILSDNGNPFSSNACLVCRGSPDK